jgi:hypothetical protein
MAACLGWYLNAGGVHPAFNSELSNDPLKAMVELPLVGWLQFVLGCGGTCQMRTVTILYDIGMFISHNIIALRTKISHRMARRTNQGQTRIQPR